MTAWKTKAESKQTCRPVCRLLKRGCEYKGFYKRGVNLKKVLIFKAKMKGVKSVSGETLHGFEIICPARRVR